MGRSGWQRDPGMRQRILEAATEEFARFGLGGARIDRIADAAGANKRMLYYHVGNKEELYLEVLEAVYERFRAAQRELKFEKPGVCRTDKINPSAFRRAAYRPMRFRWLPGEKLIGW